MYGHSCDGGISWKNKRIRKITECFFKTLGFDINSVGIFDMYCVLDMCKHSKCCFATSFQEFVSYRNFCKKLYRICGGKYIELAKPTYRQKIRLWISKSLSYFLMNNFGRNRYAVSFLFNPKVPSWRHNIIIAWWQIIFLS